MACRPSAASFCRLPVAAQVHGLSLHGFLERRWPQQFARIERTEITGPAEQPLPAERAADVAAVREALGFRTIKQERHGNVIEVQTAKKPPAALPEAKG